MINIYGCEIEDDKKILLDMACVKSPIEIFEGYIYIEFIFNSQIPDDFKKMNEILIPNATRLGVEVYKISEYSCSLKFKILNPENKFEHKLINFIVENNIGYEYYENNEGENEYLFDYTDPTKDKLIDFLNQENYNNYDIYNDEMTITITEPTKSSWDELIYKCKDGKVLKHWGIDGYVRAINDLSLMEELCFPSNEHPYKTLENLCTQFRNEFEKLLKKNYESKMSEKVKFKYTEDGKKVVVIEKINNYQSLVKEVFITDTGNEVISEQKFVVDKLFDTPVKSWHDVNITDKEKQLKILENDIQKKSTELKEIKQKLYAYREIIKSTERLCQNLNGKELDTLAGFLSGTINYVVEFMCGKITPPQKFEDKIIKYKVGQKERNFDYIRLGSIFGKSNGKISYKINDYSDGSGCNFECFLFETYQEAIDFIKSYAEKRIDKETLDIESFKNCIDMGIKFDKEIVEKYNSKIKDEHDKKIKHLESKIDELNNEIDKFKSNIKTIDGKINELKSTKPDTQ